MRIFPRLLGSAILAALLFTAGANAQPMPPAAEKKPHALELHGETLNDPYFWLRERESTAVMDHLKRENEYAAAITAGTEGLRKTLYAEMLSRVQQTDVAVPTRDNGYWYYARTEEGKAYSIFCRRKGTMEWPEEVLLDVNKEAMGKPFLAALPLGASPDNRTLAWSEDPTGGRKMVIHFRDLATGKEMPDTVENAAGSFAWGADSATYYYTTLDPAIRADKAWRGALGSRTPQLLHHETDERFNTTVSRSRSRAFVILAIASMKSSEARILRTGDNTGSFRVVEPRAQGMEYSIDHQGDRFLILHNDGEKALNFQLDTAPEAMPTRDHWTPLIPHRSDTYLTGVDAFKDYFVTTQRRNGLSELRVRRMSDGAEHIIGQTEAAYTVSPGTNLEYDTALFRFTYASPVTPTSLFEYDMGTKQRTLLKEQPVPGGYDRGRYTVERTFATASDGEQVPVSLLFLKGTPRDGTAPALLTGYGSYGYSAEPRFNSNWLSLVDRGFIIAIAHIRGGSEKGRAWYEGGRMMHKRNTFTDFIAAADHLVKEKYTSPSKLVIRGGSAGGLLMGAVINMRPDLCAVCIADVPFVDLINTMMDDSLPLTVVEYEQWGNPHDKAAFEYMRSYSPYDNIGKKPYPAVLSMTGFNDTNVCYWEPAKWVARLREHTTSGRPIVLKVNLDAGHSGNSDRYKAMEDEAYRFAFILGQMGLGK